MYDHFHRLISGKIQDLAKKKNSQPVTFTWLTSDEQREAPTDLIENPPYNVPKINVDPKIKTKMYSWPALVQTTLYARLHIFLSWTTLNDSIQRIKLSIAIFLHTLDWICSALERNIFYRPSGPLQIAVARLFFFWFCSFTQIAPRYLCVGRCHFILFSIFS